MAKRKIAWTNTAAKQRREILRYWTEKNQSTDYAEKLIEITAKHLNIIARNPEAFYLIVKALKDLNDDETLLIQSGKPVGILPTQSTFC